jgi:CRISPR/Cas system-associated exonuclease Cas4 (RecB family)
MKLDVLVHVGDDEAIVIDYKTGRKFGNEVKHSQQLQLYALATFLRHPHLEVISAELFYIDIGETTRQTFTRDQALRFKRSFDKQGTALTDCTDFPPNPNKWSCQYCPWGPEHTGHCQVGVRKA